MKRKIISVLLTAAMVVSLAACGGGGNTSSESGGGSDNVQSSESGEADGELYTVTMVLNGTQQPDEERIEAKVNEILEKELNARLDLVVLPWANASQQLQLMLAGDEKIDIFYTGATNAVQYMHSGQIMDMSGLIDQYGTNLKNVFGEDIAKINSLNGFVYGVPVQRDRGNIPAVFMRKDLVEKYNIDTSAIKEPKDMEAVFEIVKAGEPDMTMLYSSSSADTPGYRLFGGDFLADSGYLGVLMDPENSTVIENFYASDWYRETTGMLYDWYQKGYISRDAGTNTENWRTVFKAGNAFALFFAYHPGTPVEFESSTGYEFEIIPFREYPIKMAESYNGVIFSIAQNSENPEKAMEVLDFIYGSPEIMNLLNWGEEGVDYVLEDAENGIINYPEGVTADTVGYSLNLGWELPNQYISYKWSGSDADLWEKMGEFNDSARESKALGFYFDNSECENQITALNNIVEQYAGSLNSGSADPETYIPEFLNALEEAGINEVIAAKQEQFDKWMAE
ncbi:MAG: ABC transporter substrate-binding protein [Lachnospiraceae bacterium]|nr:ABC transporter substrate-binding protein [Lachnospiraceae bacterium]